MTAVLAIDFHYQIVIISDCRVSWEGGNYDSQDNLQKVYPVGNVGLLAFAGDIYSTKVIFQEIRKNLETKGELINFPPSPQFLEKNLPLWIKEAYSSIPASQQNYVEIMFVASDVHNVSMRAQNVVFSDSLMLRMVSPSFQPEINKDAIRLGYANKYPLEHIIQSRDNMLNLGLTPEQELFKVGIIIGEFSKALNSYSPNQVGGLFAIGIIDAKHGIRWFPYSSGDWELKIEDGKFVQYDLANDRRIALKTLWEFNPRKPDMGNLKFGPLDV